MERKGGSEKFSTPKAQGYSTVESKIFGHLKLPEYHSVRYLTHNMAKPVN